jgi:NADH:ubiquinone oxidoreductase subunit 3 (subunit A)
MKNEGNKPIIELVVIIVIMLVLIISSFKLGRLLRREFIDNNKTEATQ